MWLGVDKSKSVSTPGVVQRDLKDWETEALGPDEHSMFRAIVGKVQWIVRGQPDVLYATKDTEDVLALGHRAAHCVVLGFTRAERDHCLRLASRRDQDAIQPRHVPRGTVPRFSTACPIAVAHGSEHHRTAGRLEM